jgi:hypothetical protein
MSPELPNSRSLPGRAGVLPMINHMLSFNREYPVRKVTPNTVILDEHNEILLEIDSHGFKEPEFDDHRMIVIVWCHSSVWGGWTPLGLTILPLPLPIGPLTAGSRRTVFNQCGTPFLRRPKTLKAPHCGLAFLRLLAPLVWRFQPQAVVRAFH